MVGHVVRHFVHMLAGVHVVMGSEGGVKVRWVLRDESPSADAHTDAGCSVSFAAVHTETTGTIVHRRDAVAFPQRLAGGVGRDAFAQPVHAANHFVTGHHAAFAELAAPHVH